MTDHLTD